MNVKLRFKKPVIIFLAFIMVFSISVSAQNEVTYAGDNTNTPSGYAISLNSNEIGTASSTPVSPTPTPNNRPPTPSVRRTPGPTEVDLVRDISGRVTISNDSSIDASGFTVNILGDSTYKTTNSDGSFSGYSVYSCAMLRISKPGYLAREVQIEHFFYTNNISIEMFAGDINADDTINMTDIMKIAACFNTNSTSENYSEICDLNKDKAINLADVMIAAKNFNAAPSAYKNLTPNFMDTQYNIDLTVEPAMNITSTSADIKGAIYRMSSSQPITPVWIEYWQESNPSKITSTSSNMIFYSPDFILKTITGLSPGTTYMYRVNSGLSSSETRSFKTLSN